MSAPPAADNSEQRTYWNEQAGPRWVALQEGLDAQLGPLGSALLERIDLAPGERVLDVGCGCGESSLAAAEAVAPGGSVLGLDVSEPMLARARERAARAGLEAVRFQMGDAQTQRFEPDSFDVLLSRFGVMFFASPEEAFRNLRSALAPGARGGFLCWQPMALNPWMAEPAAAVAELVPMPPPPPPEAPGPFSFADADRVRSILLAAGFEAPRAEALEGRLHVGGARTVEEAGEFLIELGPAARALREAGAGPELRRRAVECAAEAVRPWLGEDGVRAPYAAWIVTFRSPR